MNAFAIVEADVERARRRTVRMRRGDRYAFRQAVDLALAEIEQRLEAGHGRTSFELHDYLEECAELVQEKGAVPWLLLPAHAFALELQQRERCRRQRRPYITIETEDRREGNQARVRGMASDG